MIRSSKREPTAMIRSQSCITLLASNVPCMPSIAEPSRIVRGKGAKAHQGST